MVTGSPKRVALLAVTLVAGLLAAGDALAGVQGCVVTNPANPQSPNPCTYTAGDDGSYAARGDWRIAIVRAGTTISLGSATGDPPAGVNAVHAGDTVTAEALTPGSTVTVGNPSPLAKDAPPPPKQFIDEDDRVVRSFDGTPLVYRLMLPKGASPSTPVPALIVTSGLGGGRHDYDPAVRGPNIAAYLIDQGYALLTHDPRGFGQSGGQSEIDSYDYEARDMSALIDRLAADARIARNGPGDPRVGMFGGSYGGGIQFVTAARDHRVDAITPDSAWNNLVEVALPDDVFKLPFVALVSSYGLKDGIADGLAPGPAGSHVGSEDPMLARAVAEGTATGGFTPAVRAWFDAHGPDRFLDRITTPTFIVHGTHDNLVQPAQAVANFKALAKQRPRLPLKMTWYCGGHGSTCTSSGVEYYNEMVTWFDRYVKGDRSVDTGPRFEYWTQGGAQHVASNYPPPGAARVRGNGRGLLVVNGEPGHGGGIDYLTPLAHDAKAGATTLKVPIATGAATAVGAPRVRLTATAVGAATDSPLRVPLFFRLVDTSDGTVLGNQETPKAIPADGHEHTVSFAMQPVAYALGAAGHLALEIGSTSANYEPYRGAAVVRLDDIEVKVPVLR